MQYEKPGDGDNHPKSRTQASRGIGDWNDLAPVDLVQRTQVASLR